MSRLVEIAYPCCCNVTEDLCFVFRAGVFFVTGREIVLKECVFHAKECVDRVWASFVYF